MSDEENGNAIVEAVTEAAAEVVADQNATTETSEQITEALIEANLATIEEQRRQEFQMEIRRDIAAMGEVVAATAGELIECRNLISELTERLNSLTLSQATTAQTAQTAAELSILAASSPSEEADGQRENLAEASPEVTAEAVPNASERQSESPPQVRKRRVVLL